MQHTSHWYFAYVVDTKRVVYWLYTTELVSPKCWCSRRASSLIDTARSVKYRCPRRASSLVDIVDSACSKYRCSRRGSSLGRHGWLNLPQVSMLKKEPHLWVTQQSQSTRSIVALEEPCPWRDTVDSTCPKYWCSRRALSLGRHSWVSLPQVSMLQKGLLPGETRMTQPASSIDAQEEPHPWGDAALVCPKYRSPRRALSLGRHNQVSPPNKLSYLVCL